MPGMPRESPHMFLCKLKISAFSVMVKIVEKMADQSDTTVNSDIFVDDVKTAIKAMKESKKRPDIKARGPVTLSKTTLIL